MKALQSVKPGDGHSLVLAEMADPVPGPGEVRVAVEACGINFPDVLIIEDRYQFKPERPFAPGGEVAGTVDAVGEGVTDLKVGQRVLAGAGWGGLSEKVCVEQEKVFALPDKMPMDVAAAFMMTYGTSHHALFDRGSLKDGEVLLVLGAAGGVGLAAVELGKARGAKVIAAVSTKEKAQVTRDHGADAAVIYPSGELTKDEAKAFTAAIREHAPDGVDVIYDAVGGSYAEPALRSIAWDGRYLVVGFAAGIPKIPLNLPLLKGCYIVGVFWGEFVNRNPERHARNAAELFQMYEAGHLRPHISGRYPLARGGEAIAQLASRAAVGKILVITERGEQNLREAQETY